MNNQQVFKKTDYIEASCFGFHMILNIYIYKSDFQITESLIEMCYGLVLQLKWLFR